MKSNTIMLNSFDYCDVEEVFNHLNFNNPYVQLIAWGKPSDFPIGTPLIMKYSFEFHRVEIKPYTGGKFYPNPLAELRLVSAPHFLHLIPCQ